jgi:anti-sigma factor ChrR (cupin superfamily)
MTDDSYRASAEAYALGSLDGDEKDAFCRHLRECGECLEAVEAHTGTVGSLGQGSHDLPPTPSVRERILDLAEAPRLPLDMKSHPWEILAPGIKACKMREDLSRGLEAWLIWAVPGARHGLHRHRGDENILVLQGTLKDHRGIYGPGDVCRSRPGSVHAEEALPGEDCICYVVSYGGFDRLE